MAYRKNERPPGMCHVLLNEVLLHNASAHNTRPRIWLRQQGCMKDLKGFRPPICCRCDSKAGTSSRDAGLEHISVRSPVTASNVKANSARVAIKIRRVAEKGGLVVYADTNIKVQLEIWRVETPAGTHSGSCPHPDCPWEGLHARRKVYGCARMAGLSQKWTGPAPGLASDRGAASWSSE